MSTPNSDNPLLPAAAQAVARRQRAVGAAFAFLCELADRPGAQHKPDKKPSAAPAGKDGGR